MVKQHKFKQKLFSTKNGAIMSKKKELKKIPVRRLRMLKTKYHFTFRSLKKKSEIIDLLDKYCCDTGVDAYDMSYLTNLTLWELQLMAKKYPINLGGHTLKSDVVEIMHLFFSQRESFIAEIEVLAMKLSSTKNGAIMSKKIKLKQNLEKLSLSQLSVLAKKYNFTFRSLQAKAQIIELLYKYCCDTDCDTYDKLFLGNLSLQQLRDLAWKYAVNLQCKTLKRDLIDIMYSFFSQRKSVIKEIEALAAKAEIYKK